MNRIFRKTTGRRKDTSRARTEDLLSSATGPVITAPTHAVVIPPNGTAAEEIEKHRANLTGPFQRPPAPVPG